MATAAGKVLFVGSLGLPDAETAFRALAKRVGNLAKRYPDGEPGERGYWIRWQNAVFAAHPDLELVRERKIEGYKAKLRLNRFDDYWNNKILPIRKGRFKEPRVALDNKPPQLASAGTSRMGAI